MGKLRYKGYTGSVEFDDASNTLVGKVLGLKHNHIIYEGDNIKELRRVFEEAVDSYLNECAEEGVQAEKPYNGNVVFRMTSELHQQAVEKATSLGISLNEFIKRAVAAAL